MRNLKIVVTGVCGRIAYSLFSPLCNGFVFGSEVEIDLRLVEVAAKKQDLSVLREELDDCCFLNVVKVTTFTDEDQEKPYIDADVVIFLGSMPRRPGMDRHEVYEINAEIFQKQGKYLDAVAKKTCKSLVIANPTCTNCMVLAANAPSIPTENFTALTRLDYNRFVGQTAKFLGCKPGQINNIIVWGNHSRKEMWDASHVEVDDMPIEEVTEKMKSFDVSILEKEMYERGGFIHEKSKGNAYISATKAIVDHLKDWFGGSHRVVSMGVVLKTEKYGIPPGLCFSMPTTCVGGGEFKIIESLQLNEDQKKRMKQNCDQLMKQKALVSKFLPSSS